MQTAQQFYGKAFTPQNAEMLEAAHKTFEMAMKSQTPGIADRALNLAAEKERKAFAA